MNVQKPRPWRLATIGFVLLYCLLLALVFAAISFSEEDAARRYFAQVENRPPAPLPPLPVVRWMELPDIEMRRDPFQPLATSTKRGPSELVLLGTSGDTPTMGPFRLVASYRDLGQPYVVGHGSTGELARFRVGDKVDEGVIERIDPDRVILNSGGHQHVVELLRVEPGRVQ
jgi:hypothetical protein